MSAWDWALAYGTLAAVAHVGAWNYKRKIAEIKAEGARRDLEFMERWPAQVHPDAMQRLYERIGSL